MAAIEPAPVDIETGLPFLVVGESANPTDLNYHHPWFPRRHKELLADHGPSCELDTESLNLSQLGGIALRMSYGQLTARDLHVEFHKRYAGPPIPSTVAQKFVAAVKGCSGILPRYAVKFGGGYEGEHVVLNNNLYEDMLMKRRVFPEYHYARPDGNRYYDKEHCRSIVGDFFVRYALMQDLSGAPDKVVSEFLTTDNARKRKELGGLLLRDVLSASAEPLRPVYNNLKKPPRYGSPLTAIKKQLVPHRMPNYLRQLEDRLKAA